MRIVSSWRAYSDRGVSAVQPSTLRSVRRSTASTRPSPRRFRTFARRPSASPRTRRPTRRPRPARRLCRRRAPRLRRVSDRTRRCRVWALTARSTRTSRSRSNRPLRRSSSRDPIIKASAFRTVHFVIWAVQRRIYLSFIVALEGEPTTFRLHEDCLFACVARCRELNRREQYFWRVSWRDGRRRCCRSKGPGRRVRRLGYRVLRAWRPHSS